jgi:deazaflavin-dependent oxidoreductase (nitroreductase family)
MTADIDPRAAYHAMTEALIDDIRTHGEPRSGPFLGRPVLLLTTTGAKTGAPRLVPLVFSRDGDRFVIMASKGGAPSHPAWFANLVAHPIVTVETGGEAFQARAVVTEGAERDRLWAAHVALHPGFADYEKRTTRRIPAIALERIG